MVNFILPAEPNNNQIKALRLKIMNQIRTIEKLTDLSFDLFEELKSQNPGSSLLVKWKWVINDML
jgi:hypothetical protein